jgi:hypothetical protein
MGAKQPSVDDVARLRRTVRRCTAALVATIATLGVSLQSPAEASALLVLALVSTVYLVAEFVRVDASAEASDEGRSQTAAPEDT